MSLQTNLAYLLEAYQSVDCFLMPMLHSKLDSAVLRQRLAQENLMSISVYRLTIDGLKKEI